MRDFNWALFIGCALIALGIHSAGVRIATQLPLSMHGNFHGSLHSSISEDSAQLEFLSQWEAASFLRMGSEEFDALLNSGELVGTYTVFEVDRRAYRWDDPWEWSDAELAGQPVPVRPMAYDIINHNHRIFSREKLSAWLVNRIEQ